MPRPRPMFKAYAEAMLDTAGPAQPGGPVEPCSVHVSGYVEEEPTKDNCASLRARVRIETLAGRRLYDAIIDFWDDPYMECQDSDVVDLVSGPRRNEPGWQPSHILDALGAAFPDGVLDAAKERAQRMASLPTKKRATKRRSMQRRKQPKRNPSLVHQEKIRNYFIVVVAHDGFAKFAVMDDSTSPPTERLSGSEPGPPSNALAAARRAVMRLENPAKRKKNPRRRRGDILSGGLADHMRIRDFDPEQLRAGTKVEMEHTSDPEIAREIAMDHLAEDGDYYIKLATIHNGAPRRSMQRRRQPKKNPRAVISKYLKGIP